MRHVIEACVGLLVQLGRCIAKIGQVGRGIRGRIRIVRRCVMRRMVIGRNGSCRIVSGRIMRRRSTAAEAAASSA